MDKHALAHAVVDEFPDANKAPAFFAPHETITLLTPLATFQNSSPSNSVLFSYRHSFFRRFTMVRNRILVLDDDTPQKVAPCARMISEAAPTAPRQKTSLLQIVMPTVPPRARIVDTDVTPSLVQSRLVGQEQHPRRFEKPAYVNFGDVFGEVFAEVGRELRVRRCSAYKVHETIQVDSCYSAWTQGWNQHGEYASGYKVEVSYKRKKILLPSGFEPFDEFGFLPAGQEPYPIIEYPAGECFGPNAFLRVWHDRHATELNVKNRGVRILEVEMFVFLRREGLHMVYRPCDLNRNVIDYPLIGKIAEEIRERDSLEVVEYSFATDSETLAPVGSEEIEELIWLFEWTDSEECWHGKLLVRDNAHKLRWLDITLPTEALSEVLED